jgi:hypothetical protein
MKVIAAAMVIALIAVACGGDDNQMLGDARARLAPLVQEVRNRVESFDPDGARSALAGVRETVATLRAEDAIDEQRASEILAAAADVENRLTLTPTTTTSTTTTTTTTAPSTVPAPDDEDRTGDDRGKGNDGEDRGKGNDKKDDE